MARARNIKPALFDNDLLADNDPIGRLLFIGLWTIADYKGELEWRERRIKKQLLAYDECNIKELMNNLEKTGFIRFYYVHDKTYIHIVNFTRHQNPHKNERDKGSNIPTLECGESQDVDFKGVENNHDLSGLNPNDSSSDRADSLILIPDSPILTPEEDKTKQKRFVPPTIEECIEHSNNPEESEKFVLYYESNGWKVNRNKMVNWKSALTGWIKRSDGFKVNRPQQATINTRGRI